MSYKNIKSLFKISLIGLFSINFIFIASAEVNKEINNNISRFKNTINLEDQNIKILTVVEIDLSKMNNSNQYEIYSITENIFIPNSLISTPEREINSLEVKNSDGKFFYNLSDNNFLSNERFDVIENKINILKLKVNYTNIIKTSNLNLYLDNNVAWPKTIIIKYLNKNNQEIIALNKSSYSNNINFPQVEAQSFIIEIEYSQPLVISEIKFDNIGDNSNKKYLRFLAKPNSTYQLFFNSENYVDILKGESPNFNIYNSEIKKYTKEINIIENSFFKLSDIDNDTIPDNKDNCVNIKNTDQLDENSNSRGDACDDYDLDGVINSIDNCINETNYTQADIDKDNLGDVCDKEESRFTEKNSWVIWLSLVLAISIIGILGFFVFKDLKNKEN